MIDILQMILKQIYTSALRGLQTISDQKRPITESIVKMKSNQVKQTGLECYRWIFSKIRLPVKKEQTVY